ncbi:hypothetical protein DFH09DRAFT_1072390 [Mycena vulgaris]|nr:hypothetical protein DFH09DRAFT_1072390 [Mycena vulgaris]
MGSVIVLGPFRPGYSLTKRSQPGANAHSMLLAFFLHLHPHRHRICVLDSMFSSATLNPSTLIAFHVVALRDGLANRMDRIRQAHRTAVRLDRFAEGPCAPLVRFPATFHTTLGCYQNLFTLHIRWLTVDAAFRTTLRSLSRWDDLTLSECAILARNGFLRLGTLKIIHRSLHTSHHPSQNHPTSAYLRGTTEVEPITRTNRPVSGVTILGGRVTSVSIIHVWLSPACIAPKLEFLLAITGFSPELRDLAIAVKGYTEFRCGGWGGHFGLPRMTSLALRLRILSPPIQANDGLCYTGATRDKWDRPYLVLDLGRRAHAAADHGSVSAGAARRWPELSFAQQRQALAALSLLYPSLRQVQFGWPSNKWERIGEIWEGQVESAAHRKSRKFRE